MKTGNVGNVQNNYYNQPQNVIKGGKDDEKTAGNLFENPVDSYVRGVEGAADPAALENLWNQFDQVADAVRKLVASMLGKNDATGQAFWAVRARGGFKFNEIDMPHGDFKSGETEKTHGGFNLSEADRAQAQELISEDGFFGVKQTTERIMGFAKALVGEDAGEPQIENMRSAVQKGFDEVARLFGGFDKLPDVSKDTYDAIMQAFDEWLNGGAEEEAS